MHRPRRTRALLVTLALLVAAPPHTLAQSATQTNQPTQTQTQPTQAQSPLKLPAGVTFVAQVEGVQEYRLANGLEVLLFPDASRETFTINTTYLVGSRHENYGETGMAHLLEHLVFKGTPTHPNLYQDFSQRGANVNGTTFFDRTNYYATLPATEDNLNWAVAMEADRMVNSFIAKKDLESEMTVVRNEFEQGENDPVGVLYGRVLSAAYDWHNYSNSPIGNRSDVENVPIERLQAFYRTYYQPDNAVVLLAGKFDPQAALDRIAGQFGQIPAPARQLPPQYTVEPAQDGERSVTVRRAGDVRWLISAYHVPSGAHPDYPAVSVLADLLGDNPSGRLYRSLVEGKKATAAGSSELVLHDPGLLLFYAQLGKDEDPQAAREALLDTVESYGKTPPTAQELERIRNRVDAIYDQALARPEGLGVLLSEYIALGDWRLFYWYREALKEVTPEDVVRVANTYLKRTNRTLGEFVPTEQPDRAQVPPRVNPAKLLANFQGREALESGEAIDPDPLKIEARVSREELPGGVKVALMPKKTRGNKVEVVLNLNWGDEDSVRNRLVPASFVASMLTRGSEGLSRQRIKDELERLKTQLSISGSATGASVRISTDRGNLPEVMQLVSRVLRNPVFPADEFEQLRKEAITSLEAGRNDPQAVAVQAYQRHFMPADASLGDPRYVPTLDEQLAALQGVTVEQVRAFHNDFWGSGFAQAAAVGDFDPSAFKSNLTTALDGWKTKAPYSRIEREAVMPPPVNRVLEVPDKASALIIVAQDLKISDSHPDFAALMLADELLGGGFLNSRLAMRLRQKDGLSYGAGSSLSASDQDQAGRFLAYAIFAPENLGKVETAINEELTRAVREGFTPEEFEAARAGLLQSRRVNRTSDGTLAGAMAAHLETGRTWRFSAELERQLAALTPEQVREALERHLDLSRMSVFKAGTFPK